MLLYTKLFKQNYFPVRVLIGGWVFILMAGYIPRKGTVTLRLCMPNLY
uniref:Uncharacterized protein n=1 Tax=Anguilla anguilla TaxID=7936 RepID=A0A0E9Q2Z6_ANGAN